MLCFSVQGNGTLYGIVLHCTVRTVHMCSAVRYSTVQFSTRVLYCVLHSTVRVLAVRCTPQRTAQHSPVLSAVQCPAYSTAGRPPLPLPRPRSAQHQPDAQAGGDPARPPPHPASRQATPAPAQRGRRPARQSRQDLSRAHTGLWGPVTPDWLAPVANS